MKVAMWALGMLVLSIFGVVLVNLFGNITVTDQLNYTTMRNTVEASMIDALDKAHYRAGFCLCTNKSKTDGKWVFSDDKDYVLTDIKYENYKGKCELEGYKTCEALYGEYRIIPKTFTESLIRRFSEMVNNSKDYELIIQDIIEYPPKVSIRVVSKDEEYSPTEENSGGYEITNQIDAIIEVNKEKLSEVIEEAFDDEDPTPSSGSSSEQGSETEKPSGGYTSNTSNCKWHAHSYIAYCNTGVFNLSKSCIKTTESIYDNNSVAARNGKSVLLSKAKKECKCDSAQDGSLKFYDVTDVNAIAHQIYNVYYYGTTTIACANIHGTSPENARVGCGSKCPKSSDCVARCHN